MKPDQIIRNQAQRYHRLEVPDERAQAIAHNMNLAAEAVSNNSHRLDFDRSPADYVRILRSGQDTETCR